MLKINLLPLSYRQRGLVRRVWAASVLLAILVVLGFLFWSQQLKAELSDINAQIERYRPDAEKAAKLKQEAQQVSSEIDPLRQQVAFCDQVISLPDQWIAVIENARKYIFAEVPLTALQISGNRLSMTGLAPSTRAAARFYLNAMRNPEWTDVQVNAPPAMGGVAVAGLHPRFRSTGYTLNIVATLKNPVQVPRAGGAGAGMAPGMMEPGMMEPGMAPGMEPGAPGVEAGPAMEAPGELGPPGAEPPMEGPGSPGAVGAR